MTKEQSASLQWASPPSSTSGGLVHERGTSFKPSSSLPKAMVHAITDQRGNILGCWRLGRELLASSRVIPVDGLLLRKSVTVSEV